MYRLQGDIWLIIVANANAVPAFSETCVLHTFTDQDKRDIFEAFAMKNESNMCEGTFSGIV